MNVKAIKTPVIAVGYGDLTNLLDEVVASLAEGSVVAVTSKIVSICEGRVVPFVQGNREELIVSEAQHYLPKTLSKYGHHFSIAQNTLIASAGIDESNGGEYYILWPKDPQQTANSIRQYLKARFNVQRVGVIITDSTCQPLRRGTTGICLAHSGFDALRDYIGKPDLFDRPFKVSKASVSGGLAAAATLVMGEGAEQTPLAIIEDLPFVAFQDRDPQPEELAELHISPEEDLFGPFLLAVDWLPGKKH